ncbi:unnamed protein product [Amoebophrya sp. A120]|nr:unnamed protein product [Amoebophrya sp. A120]|eukprot:GSA120T00018627001.1
MEDRYAHIRKPTLEDLYLPLQILVCNTMEEALAKTPRELAQLPLVRVVKQDASGEEVKPEDIDTPDVEGSHTPATETLSKARDFELDFKSHVLFDYGTYAVEKKVTEWLQTYVVPPQHSDWELRDLLCTSPRGRLTLCAVLLPSRTKIASAASSRDSDSAPDCEDAAAGSTMSERKPRKESPSSSSSVCDGDKKPSKLQTNSIELASSEIAAASTAPEDVAKGATRIPDEQRNAAATSSRKRPRTAESSAQKSSSSVPAGSQPENSEESEEMRYLNVVDMAGHQFFLKATSDEEDHALPLLVPTHLKLRTVKEQLGQHIYRSTKFLFHRLQTSSTSCDEDEQDGDAAGETFSDFDEVNFFSDAEAKSSLKRRSSSPGESKKMKKTRPSQDKGTQSLAKPGALASHGNKRARVFTAEGAASAASSKENERSADEGTRSSASKRDNAAACAPGAPPDPDEALIEELVCSSDTEIALLFPREETEQEQDGAGD